jgi:hypothetical protein
VNEQTDVIEKRLTEYRKKFGLGTHLTIFPDNTIVPWKVLSLGELLGFVEDLGSQRRLPCLVEDEIFKKCVKDESLCRRIDHLKAGVVSTVADHILTVSKPVFTASDFDERIEQERIKLQQNNQILHEFVKYISIAFPYKPEEIYAMTFDDFCKTLILAESKLLYLGIIKEPFTIIDEKDEGKRVRSRRKVDPKEVWEKQHGVEKEREEVAIDEDERKREAVAKKMSHFPHPFKEGDIEKLMARAKGETRVEKEPPSLTWREKLGSQRPVESSSFAPDEEILNELDIDPKDPRLSPIIKHGPSDVDFQMDELGIIRSLQGDELLDLDVNRYRMVEEAKKIYAKELRYLERKKQKALRKE